MAPLEPAARQPYREPLRVTFTRTGTIALVVGAVLALRYGGLRYWPLATLLMLWPAFGGHLVELGFLNYLRPRLPPSRPAQVAGRLAAWFAGGTALGLGLWLTAWALGGFRAAQWPAWWVAGLAFITIELAVHLVLQLFGRSNFYDGRA